MGFLGQFERTSAGKAYPSAFGLGDVDQASAIRPAVSDGLNSVDEWNRRITSKDEESSNILERQSQIDSELLRLDGDAWYRTSTDVDHKASLDRLRRCPDGLCIYMAAVRSSRATGGEGQRGAPVGGLIHLF